MWNHAVFVFCDRPIICLFLLAGSLEPLFIPSHIGFRNWRGAGGQGGKGALFQNPAYCEGKNRIAIGAEDKKLETRKKAPEMSKPLLLKI